MEVSSDVPGTAGASGWEFSVLPSMEVNSSDVFATIANLG